MSMPIYLMFIRVLLSVEFCFTLKTYLKGAPFYNASASGTCAENTSNARGSRWSDLLSLSEPQFSIACGDRPPHSLPRSFTRLIFSPLPLRRQSPFGVGLMWLLGSPVRSESDLALLIASTLSTPTACFRCVYRLCSGRNRTL